MKANEMPEKIYIFDYNDAMVTPLEGDTVYVREDAFIEKAAVWLDETLKNTDFYEDEIELMIKEFKNAMKGEPVSEDLDEAAKEDAKIERSDDSEVGYDLNRYGGFVAGAKWQKQQMIDKACEWIKLLNDTHYIMHYSDSCEVTLGELKDWFKNYMEEGGKDE